MKIVLVIILLAASVAAGLCYAADGSTPTPPADQSATPPANTPPPVTPPAAPVVIPPVAATELPQVKNSGSVVVTPGSTPNSIVFTATEPVSTVDLLKANVGSEASWTINMQEGWRLLAKADPIYGPSGWYGKVTCDVGTFVFENQAGLYIAPTANVNVNNFIATTLDISANNFRNGNYLFEYAPGSPRSQILNQGVITGNSIALIASAVDNQGTVIGRLGKVFFISGDRSTKRQAVRYLIKMGTKLRTRRQIPVPLRVHR